MTYLVIMVIVAAVGIARLWVLQRRQLSRTKTIDGFQKALVAISKPDPARQKGGGDPVPRPRSPQRGRHRSGIRELDPVRRDAARRRIAARRAARRAPRRRAAG